MLVNSMTDENVEVLCVQDFSLVISRALTQTNFSFTMVPRVSCFSSGVSELAIFGVEVAIVRALEKKSV